MKPVKTLTILTDGFEETETVVPADMLHRAGVANTFAAVAAGGRTLLKGRSEISLQADETLDALRARFGGNAELAAHFDALFIPGGPGTWTLLEDGNAAELAAAFAVKGRLVAAICAAPLVLKAAGLLDGRRVSAHSCTWDEIPAARACAPVALDGGVLTSRGAGTALAFGLAFVEALRGKAVAEKIAADVML